MTKIMFVDDDAIIRRSIANKIDWKGHGWELVYTARDPMEALDYLRDHQPDIILTDIKMPGISGIEMASIAMDYYPGIKFIFISGYKDFEYAQQVLKLNAVDYLTKPLEQEQLISVLQKAEDLYKKEKKTEEILKEKYPQLKRKYISKLMRENFQNMDTSFFEEFDININNGYGIVSFVELNFSEEISTEEKKERVEKICGSLESIYYGSIFFCMDNLQIFTIYTDSTAEDETMFYENLIEMENIVKDLVQKKLGGGSAEFVYGSLMYSLNDLYSSYQSALQKINSDVDHLLLEVRHYIEQNYSDCDLSLVKIADYFNVNHCYLTSIFKKKFDINLYDYIIRVRMENASRLILKSELKNYEIAEATGYKNPQYFSMSFKKYYNCTVTQYREKRRE
ncbi:response regulator transcription factor [Mediterraneibacter gnavus]|uniref:response regulator transcription factor n=1 Tax=Mediterraneibacter gnavus TaxID=33038 RepID=UPI0032C0823D